MFSPRDVELRAGLSPLARGTLAVKKAGEFYNRFIPAGAGNTERSIILAMSFAVYPRWRGEHNASADQELYLCGLSPLARGTLEMQLAHPWNYRFIPAGAGNTVLEFPLSMEMTVYPRWRGEHVVPPIEIIAPDGLSPLARGTLLLQKVSRLKFRFIPAGAGNTTMVNHDCSVSPVYPRWRGEHSPRCTMED